jgi:ABC-type transport system involved in multi-copper enzyme maturation permease subunit
MSGISSLARTTPKASRIPLSRVWFTSVFLKTLRDFRVAIFGWGTGLGVAIALVLVAYPFMLSTPEAKQAFVDSAKDFGFFWEPIAVSSPGGFAMFKLGPDLVFPAIWGLLAGSRLLRGEEERGSLEALLSLPRSRKRIAWEHLAALGIALLLIGMLIGVLTWLGGTSINADFSLADALIFGLNTSLVSAVFAALALFISQFTHKRRTAAGVTGALFGCAIVLNSLAHMAPGLETLARFSPVYYFGLSKAIVPRYGANAGAMVVLASLTAIFALAGITLFLRRDIGGSRGLVPVWSHVSGAHAPRIPSHEWTLRSVYAHSLGMLAGPTLWWGLGLACYGAVTTLLTRQFESTLAGASDGSSLQAFFPKLTSSDLGTNAGFLSNIFAELPLDFRCLRTCAGQQLGVRGSKWAIRAAIGHATVARMDAARALCGIRDGAAGHRSGAARGDGGSGSATRSDARRWSPRRSGGRHPAHRAGGWLAGLLDRDLATCGGRRWRTWWVPRPVVGGRVARPALQLAGHRAAVRNLPALRLTPGRRPAVGENGGVASGVCAAGHHCISLLMDLAGISI